ncbi:hypothetical protein WDL1P1_00203 (plasmid) [Variovorax sp. WDL1]|nr:hypothetical protein CHC06_05787 [Variovorax sp. B2]PNG51037.1 hypothetical protein CHC07_05693 [Variovorax sp. B4]VTU42190.1 hypothetical protein E5P1_00202 [Variovorax sp. PBL-E5]VTU44317.1 hypothetical protein H6P1_00729 [Variovorax sp. PBL-H6]VTV17210.1 hypothetical protein WDL1P1_00203 [Variovorax sp. WDL1]
MPARLAEPCHRGPLRYTRHALNEANSDRYGKVTLLHAFIPEQATLIETEAEDGPDGRNSRVVKQLWRCPMDEYRDLVMALLPGGVVKTVWVNLRSDKHRTLNKARYARR